jgi:hypothetical protein
MVMSVVHCYSLVISFPNIASCTVHVYVCIYLSIYINIQIPLLIAFLICNTVLQCSVFFLLLVFNPYTADYLLTALLKECNFHIKSELIMTDYYVCICIKITIIINIPIRNSIL